MDPIWKPECRTRRRSRVLGARDDERIDALRGERVADQPLATVDFGRGGHPRSLKNPLQSEALCRRAATSPHSARVPSCGGACPQGSLGGGAGRCRALRLGVGVIGADGGRRRDRLAGRAGRSSSSGRSGASGRTSPYGRSRWRCRARRCGRARSEPDVRSAGPRRASPSAGRPCSRPASPTGPPRSRTDAGVRLPGRDGRRSRHTSVRRPGPVRRRRDRSRRRKVLLRVDLSQIAGVVRLDLHLDSVQTREADCSRTAAAATAGTSSRPWSPPSAAASAKCARSPAGTPGWRSSWTRPTVIYGRQLTVSGRVVRGGAPSAGEVVFARRLAGSVVEVDRARADRVHGRRRSLRGRGPPRQPWAGPPGRTRRWPATGRN